MYWLKTFIFCILISTLKQETRNVGASQRLQIHLKWKVHRYYLLPSNDTNALTFVWSSILTCSTSLVLSVDWCQLVWMQSQRVIQVLLNLFRLPPNLKCNMSRGSLLFRSQLKIYLQYDACRRERCLNWHITWTKLGGQIIPFHNSPHPKICG